MLGQQDRHVTDKGNVSHNAANDVFPHQVVLSLGIQFRVVSHIVISFCQ